MAANTIQLAPKRTRGKPTDDGDFVVFEHVAVFDEHIGDDGVHYDRGLLGHIAENCNRRIRRTGDWCPVVVAHTRDMDDKTSVNDDPPVIGLAGPFYVGTIDDEHPRACIFGTFWIFPENEQQFLRNPRRSVEIWPEDKPENRYFDPIAVLGGETPRRDLGMIYAKRRILNGPLRYSKRSVGPLRYQEDGGDVSSAPYGSNTFIPGGTEKPKRNSCASYACDRKETDTDQPERYEQEPAMTQEDLQQIVDALEPLIDAKLSEMTLAPPDGGDTSAPPTAAPPSGPPAPPIDDDLSDLDEDDIGGGTPDEIEPPELNDEDSQYAKSLGRKLQKYMAAGDEPGMDAFSGTLDDQEQGLASHYFKYMCDDSDHKKKYAERYGKDQDVEERAADSTPSGSRFDEPFSGKQRNSKDHDLRQKYSKLRSDHAELTARYQKSEKDNSELRQAARHHYRKSRLTEVASHHAIDVDDELETTSDFTDEQFDRHVGQTIPTHYQKLSGRLPHDSSDGTTVGSQFSQTPAGKSQYSKEDAQTARDLCLRHGLRGKYAKALDVAHRNRGNRDAAERELLASVGTNGNGKA